MNKKQALQGVISYPLPGFDLAVDKALTDAGINGEDIYQASDEQAVDMCAAKLILFILMSPKSISDNGFSISQADREGLRQIRSYILTKYGLIDLLDEGDNKAYIYGDSHW